MSTNHNNIYEQSYMHGIESSNISNTAKSGIININDNFFKEYENSMLISIYNYQLCIISYRKKKHHPKENQRH